MNGKKLRKISARILCGAGPH